MKPLKLLLIPLLLPVLAAFIPAGTVQADPPPFAFDWYSPTVSGVLVAPNGDVYTASVNGGYLRRLRRDGNLIYEINQLFELDIRAAGMEVDAEGNLYIIREAPATWTRLFKVAPNGRQVWMRSITGVGGDLTVGSDGNIYVTCNYPPSLTVWSPEGVRLDTRETVPTGRLSATDDGYYFQVAHDVSSIGKFTLESTQVGSWTLPGRPTDVDVAPDGRILVCSEYSVMRYSADMVLEDQWGRYGDGDGQFDDAYGVAVNDLGDVYVADYFNDRVQMFGTRQATDDPPPWPGSPPPPPPPPPPIWPPLTADHPASVMLHLASTEADSCNPPGTLQDIVTSGAAASDGSARYFVYLLATPDTRGDLTDAGTAGLQLGIEYSVPAGEDLGLVVEDWHLCAVLEFADDDWPARGTGNTITWGVPDCDRSDVAVAGFFTVTAYSPATMSVAPWPNTGLVKVADCSGGEGIPDQQLGLDQVGWVSLGGGRRGTDTDGCNPAVEACIEAVPVERTTWGNIKSRYR